PCSSAHPLLRSFPTRRSSDLVAHVIAGQVHHHVVIDGEQLAQAAVQLGAVEAPQRDGAWIVGSLQLGRASQGQDSDGGSSAQGRSEEHTSELQSRENLVCRLL